ncbi:LysR family transcriptional regulator [Allokutzneria albata]|uniref:DNA-binding transcriptional regulator, LysR family n=1 Tax=Allokutzneria albata TaxID=211114 RepID=A0A1G9TDK1_ALLAB|nr:LysR family transcriptional regulator [Allokutzneria albata]SDM45809.1 DNA-binding transcriptional regulator, LysR family [Allokutzneria albata]
MADPGQLRLLALIEDHGSLAAAAHVLGLTPAAVTQQVARAERDFKVPLVLRGPRGASLTAAGALLAAHGRVIDRQAEEADARLAALLGHLSLRLRVGAFQAAALHLLPPALTALRHRHPHAELSIRDVASHQGIEEIVEDRLDLAVIASWGAPPEPPPHIAVHSLMLDPLVVVLPDDHPLVTDRPLRLEDLRHESWVTILAGHAAREQFDRAALAAGFTPKIRFQTASYDVAQALVGTGIGVALVSRLALSGVPGTVHREVQPRLHRTLHAVTRADTALTPLADVFLELLRDVAGDVTAPWS